MTNFLQKNKTFLGFILLYFSIASSVVAQFSTIFEGKIKPAATYEIVIEYQYQYLVYQPKRQLLKTNQKGEFSFQIPLKESTWLNWTCKNKEGQIYLHVGDSLNIQLKMATLPFGTTFSGLGAVENNFYQKYSELFGSQSKNALYPQKYKSLTSKNFKAEVKRLRKNQLKLLEETIGEKPLSDDFILAMKQRIEYEYANHLAEYPVLNALLNNKKPKIPTKEYYSFFEEIIIQSPSALRQVAYLRFLKNYLEFRYTKFHQENTLKAYSKFYYPMLFEVTEQELIGTVQAHAQALLILEMIDTGNKKLYKKFYKKYLQKHSTDESAKILKEYLKEQQKLKVGSLVPDFSLPNALKGQRIKISDFKGKMVYLLLDKSQSKYAQNLKGIEHLQNRLLFSKRNEKTAVRGCLYLGSGRKTEYIFRKTS